MHGALLVHGCMVWNALILTFSYIHIHTYIHVHVHVHIHIHVHVHTHTYIHTYIHACAALWESEFNTALWELDTLASLYSSIYIEKSYKEIIIVMFIHSWSGRSFEILISDW